VIFPEVLKIVQLIKGCSINHAVVSNYWDLFKNMELLYKRYIFYINTLGRGRSPSPEPTPRFVTECCTHTDISNSLWFSPNC